MGRILVDAYDKLLCRCDGTGTSFSDDSTANVKTITPHGNATQLPIKFNKSAGFFNGTTDYVVVPASTDFDFGTADYNYEFFFNMTTVQNCFFTDVNDKRFSVWYNSGALYVYQAGNARITYTWTPTKNTWYHIRVRRVAGTTTLYVDGTSQGTPYSGSDNITTSSNPIYIGEYSGGGSYYLSGWMKELRIIKGASTTVTVPTAEYTASSEANTVLLMHFDTPATSPLAPWIRKLTGTNWLSAADSTDFDFGSGAYDISFDVRMDAVTGQPCFVAVGNSSEGVVATWYSNNLYVYSAGSAITFAWIPLANVNYHVTVKRDGSSNMSAYVNNAQIGVTQTVSTNYNTSAGVGIGRDPNGTVGGAWNGYIKNVVITKGTTVVLNVKGDENNGVTTFIDSSTSPKTITTNGTPVINYQESPYSCIFKDETGKFPYPVGSAKVDFFAIGSGCYSGVTTTDFISVGADADFAMGTGSFSTGGYFRLNATPSQYVYFGEIGNGYSGNGFGIRWWANVLWLDPNGGTSQNMGTFIPPVNTWFHVEYDRVSGGASTVYINGTATGSVATDSYNYNQATYAFRLGVDATNAYYLNGRADNIRISKGVARYVSTFNPPDDVSGVKGYVKSEFFALL